MKASSAGASARGHVTYLTYRLVTVTFVTFPQRNHSHIIFNLAVLSCIFALYVFDVYIDVFNRNILHLPSRQLHVQS